MGVGNARGLKGLKEGELASDEARGGPGAGHPDAEGGLLAKMVTPAAGRDSVHHLKERFGGEHVARLRAGGYPPEQFLTSRRPADRRLPDAARMGLKPQADQAGPPGGGPVGVAAVPEEGGSASHWSDRRPQTSSGPWIS